MRVVAEPIDTFPTEIKLHKKSQTLEIQFDNGERFELPCEYLRVYSPSAEAVGHAPGQETLQTGKQHVNISEIKPVGNYGITPTFTDGHNSGIYTWELLYKLGRDYHSLWNNYLNELDKTGQSRIKP